MFTQHTDPTTGRTVVTCTVCHEPVTFPRGESKAVIDRAKRTHTCPERAA